MEIETINDFEEYIEHSFKYRVRLHIQPNLIDKYAKWCAVNVRKNEYDIKWEINVVDRVPVGYFLCSFKNEADLIVFKLRWGV